MHVKTIMLAMTVAGWGIAAGSVSAQQPAPAPAPAEPPIGAVTPTTAAIRRVQDSMQAADARSQVPVVTLTDAINLALKYQPQVVTAVANVDIARANQRLAVGNWLPSVTASSSVSKSAASRFNTSTGQIVPVTTPYTGSIGVNASLVLFDGLGRVFQGRQANAQAVSAEASLVNNKFQVALATKQAFFSALAAADLERVALASVQRSEEQLKIAREKLLAGSAIRSDTLSAMVTLGQAQLQLLTAETQRATQEATLARLIGFDRTVRPVGDSSLFALTSVDTAAVRSEAVQSSPAVAAADAQLVAAEAVVTTNKTTYLPTITATYSNQRSGGAAGFGGAFDYPSLFPTWQLQLGASWPIFNGLKRETALWIAQANRDAAVATAADAKRNVNAQVTQYEAALLSAETSFQIAEASREAADEALRIQRERYRLGAATIVDVLNAQVQLNQAESDQVNARVNYQIAKAQLEALVGHSL